MQRHKAIFIFLLVLAISGCGVRPQTTPPLNLGIPLKDICERYNVQWQWDGLTQVVFLEQGGNKAKALVGSNVILLGKEKIFLSAPLRRHNSTIYVPDDFESKVLAPFGVTPLRGGGSISSWVKTIVIDAGHGGKDPGAKGVTGALEKEVVLDISKRLAAKLGEAGFKVIMTRHSDEFIPLPKRTEITSKSDADLYVSIHANSNPSRKIQGLEVYYVKSETKKDLDEEQRRKNEKMFSQKLNGVKNAAIQKITADMMYTLKVAESERLARTIAQRSAKETDCNNRGARSCRFFVVRNTLVPAVLVEVGYLTNRQEEKKLKSPQYRQKMAEAIARSIRDYAFD